MFRWGGAADVAAPWRASRLTKVRFGIGSGQDIALSPKQPLPMHYC